MNTPPFNPQEFAAFAELKIKDRERKRDVMLVQEGDLSGKKPFFGKRMQLLVLFLFVLVALGLYSLLH